MPNNKFSPISLFDIYEDVNTSFTEKKSELISLLEKHIDFSSLISYGFHHAFYSTFGRKHKYHLESFIKALIIQKLFAFSYDSQLILAKSLHELTLFKSVRKLIKKVSQLSFFNKSLLGGFKIPSFCVTLLLFVFTLHPFFSADFFCLSFFALLLQSPITFQLYLYFIKDN